MKHKLLLTAITSLMALSSTALADTGYVTIGTGTSSSNYVPYDSRCKYSTTQSIYTAAEIGTRGTIMTLAYNVANASGIITTSVKIYMGHTSKSSFSSNSDYENVSNMTLVYSGSPLLSLATGWEILTLTTPFAYNGTDNLVIVVGRQSYNYNENAKYYCSSTSSTQCLRRSTDSSSSYGNPSSTGNYSTTQVRADVRLGFVKKVGQFSYFFTSDTTTTVCGTTASGTINIPTSVTIDGKNYAVTAINGGAFQNRTNITSVTIPSSVTSIGSCAFYGCFGLTGSLTIPASVTRIGNDAFTGCKGIKEVKIEDGTTELSLGYKSNSSSSSYYYGLFKDCPIETLYLGRNLSYSTRDYHSYYPGYGAPFEYQSEMKSVTIGKDVTKIGDYAFYVCSNLRKVINCSQLKFSKGSSNYGDVAYYAYGVYNNCSVEGDFVITTDNGKKSVCGYLGTSTYVTLPSVDGIADYAFYYCSKLDNVTIPSSVTNIGDCAFYGNTNIQSLTIGSGVTTIGSNAFNYTPTKTIWLTNTPPSGYSQASGTVNYVSNNNFTSLSNTKVYAYLSSMFEADGIKYVPVNPSERTCDAIDCTYLLQDSIVTIGKTVSYRNIAMTVKHVNDYVAYRNSNVKNLTIDADCDINQYAFYQSTNLQNVNLSNTGNIGSSAFYGCTALQTAEISNTGNIGSSAFYGCTALQTTQISNTGNIGSQAFYDCSQLSTCTIGDAVTALEYRALCGCSSLPTIQLGKNIKMFGTEAFRGCSNLEEIAIPDATTTLGTSCFSGCTSLKKADTGDGITAIPSYAFSGCSALETITIGEGVKTIDTYAFQNCSSLADIAIPSNVNKIDNYVFAGCSKLADVVIADRKLELSLGYNGSSKPLFSDCPLDSIYIGGKITYSTSSSYGYSPFYRNTSLRTVVITNEETEIYPNEFYGCTGLKNVKIGDGVKKIGDYAFSGCSSLESFGFGEGMQSIGKEAFSDCTSLTRILSEAAVPPTCGSQALEDINKWECTLYVPKANIAAYQAADQWKDFFFVEENVEFTNGIESVIEDTEAKVSPVLNLQGQRIAAPAKGEIYILQGKKMLMK